MLIWKTRTRQKALEQPTGSFQALADAAVECLRKLESTKPVRLVGVSLGKLPKSADLGPLVPPKQALSANPDGQRLSPASRAADEG